MKILEAECTVSVHHKNKEWELAVTRTLEFDGISDRKAYCILNRTGTAYQSFYEKVRSVCEKCGWDFWGIDSIKEKYKSEEENEYCEKSLSFFDDV